MKLLSAGYPGLDVLLSGGRVEGGCVCMGEWVTMTTVLTRPAVDALRCMHDRTRVIVPRELQGDWLDPGPMDKGQVASLLDAIPDPKLTLHGAGKPLGGGPN